MIINNLEYNREIFGEDWLDKFVARQVQWLQGCKADAVSKQNPRSSDKVTGSGESNCEVYDSSRCVSQVSPEKGSVSEQKPCDMTEFFNKIRQSPIFEDGVGLVKDFQADIQVKEGSAPVYRKSRTVAYALREKVNDDLRRQVKEGLLENVEHT